ncbi:outer membrane lipid asymmetry maintenance protein MlaD [Chitinimonas koreensis]|uniref:outer membrane lipid asymmetry maintenance protein MlaD n=1 Tax=Chitinimonas koreensis TaxID=356302 RepID=UPI000416860F|nr:outer membrane lipid asymmetry maintenance protein MlaD [Chitinimonas koreensis]QNM96319.1 outer membrane lipid asymmetry maintenance protein MlaD [Chitinimonas koreensis]
MNRRAYDFWVGVFVVLGLAALAFLALRVSNVSSGNGRATYRVTAAFDNIGGLKAKAPIRSAGVLVGRVAGIRLDPETYRAVVSLDIEQGYHFSRDSSAEILTSGILGDQYIGLTPGGEETMLKNGDRITLTSSALVLEKLISQFMFSKASENPTEAKPAP